MHGNAFPEVRETDVWRGVTTRRYEGPYDSLGSGARCGTPGATNGAGVIRGDATVIATSGAVKLGGCGLTTSWRCRWHDFIVGHCDEPGFSCGQ